MSAVFCMYEDRKCSCMLSLLGLSRRRGLEAARTETTVPALQVKTSSPQEMGAPCPSGFGELRQAQRKDTHSFRNSRWVQYNG